MVVNLSIFDNGAVSLHLVVLLLLIRNFINLSREHGCFFTIEFLLIDNLIVLSQMNCNLQNNLVLYSRTLVLFDNPSLIAIIVSTMIHTKEFCKQNCWWRHTHTMAHARTHISHRGLLHSASGNISGSEHPNKEDLLICSSPSHQFFEMLLFSDSHFWSRSEVANWVLNEELRVKAKQLHYQSNLGLVGQRLSSNVKSCPLVVCQHEKLSDMLLSFLIAQRQHFFVRY